MCLNPPKSLTLTSLALLIFAAMNCLAETLPPLKDNKAPQNLRELWAGFDPRQEPLETEILKEWEQDGVILKVLRYRVGVFKGQKAMMAAVYAYPKGGRNLPGLVQIHGGGQYAHYNACLTNAKRGYATLSIAWAGRIEAPGYRVSPHEVKLFWEGKTEDPHYRLTTDWGALDAYHAPSRNGRDAFPSIPVASWTLDAVESPRNNSWFLCALGARRGLTFLERQPEVDPEKLGVYGHSMGGKLTVLTAGADTRVKAAAPSCGGMSDRYSSNELHLRTVSDPPSLKRITCPTIFLSPANDFHGRINDLQTAVKEIQSKEWRVTCAPHHNHQDTAPYEVATQLWFDEHLKGSFSWPKTPKTELRLKNFSGMPMFGVSPDPSQKVLSVDVFYTQQGLADDQGKDLAQVKRRFWYHAAAEKKGQVWMAKLPVFSTDRPLWVYANISYSLEKPVTGAGYYYRTYTAEQFNLSSLMTMVKAEDLQTAGLKPTLKPELEIEAFGDDWEKEWFTYQLSGWERRSHKLNEPRWAAPQNAGMRIELRSEHANKLVIGIDHYAAEIELPGGMEWQSRILRVSDFKDAHGEALPSWEGLGELRLEAQATLRSTKRNDTTRRKVGAPWKGAEPEFRTIAWVVSSGLEP